MDDDVAVPPGSSGVRYGESSGRWVLLATVLGSSMAFVDATIVNVALPSIGEDLDAGLAGLQWAVNGYTLTLAALILLGGSLGDRFGRRRVFVIGVAWFAVASLLCGIAPDIGTLVAARALQGIGGALLTPGSLAILQASFVPEDRARAIGAWSGLGGVAGAFGPFLGGYLVQVASWRWAFLVNVPAAVAVVLITLRHVPESRDEQAKPGIDATGAILGAVGLAGLTYGLIAWAESSAADPLVWGSLAIGLAGGVAFVVTEQRSPHPMLPLDVFSSRQFTATNAVTLLVYAALSGVFFLLVLQLQVVARFGPIAAGVALLPVTIVMLLLSSRMGALAQRMGPRRQMTIGPIIAAGGVAWMAIIGPDASYLVDVLGPVAVFGLGLAVTVAPLTATALASVEARHVGVASGVNNSVARAGGLLAVAALPLLVGLTGTSYADPLELDPAFGSGMLICAGLLVAGGLLAGLTVRGGRVLSGANPADSR